MAASATDCYFCGAKIERYLGLAEHLIDWHNRQPVNGRVLAFNSTSSGYNIICWCGEKFGSRHAFASHLQEAGGLRKHLLPMLLGKG